MKVYQLIYTSVQHSLSDAQLGLVNQPGMRVYSCSQGVTRENIEEITRFASYRLPKNNDIAFSEVIGDPTIPGMFPKIFRTLHLSDGRYAAIQSVFSGVDYQNQPRNFFAHALIFDEVDNSFFPEQYCGSEIFKTYLTTEEAEKELVHYLPVLEDIKPDESFEKEIKIFIDLHKKEMSYLLKQALMIMGSDTITHMCISTESEYLTQSYLVALKYMLPRDIEYNTGISTYNVYIPSDKQNQIIFNGTIKGKNNITRQAVEMRTTCMYIDMEKTDFVSDEGSPLFKWSMDELRGEYEKYNFESVQQLNDWLSTHENTNKPGMGAKLLRFKESAGDKRFSIRAAELYEHIDDEDMKPVRFEVCKVMYDNSKLFPELLQSITDNYVTMCLNKLCRGQNYDIEDIFPDGAEAKAQAQLFKNKMMDYMEIIRKNFDTIGQHNKYLLLTLLAQVKHETGDPTWKAFFKDRKLYITTFTEMASMIVTGYGVRAFSPPSVWTKEELHEMIAYFDSSTQDERIKKSCLKYIYFHDDVVWENYGITLTKHTKTAGEQEKDLRKVKSMLTSVGYIPFGNTSYMDLRHQVTADMYDNISPLLLSRLLYAYYRWSGTYGNQSLAKSRAAKVKALLLEMKRTEKSCYDYIIPKLALEIIETQGHYHEVMINTETMPDSFWNWFLIGFGHCKNDDDKILNYTRVYQASRSKLLRLPDIRQKMRAAFKNVE